MHLPCLRSDLTSGYVTVHLLEYFAYELPVVYTYICKSFGVTERGALHSIVGYLA